MTILSVPNCANVSWEKNFFVRYLNVSREMHVTPELPFTAMRHRFTKHTEGHVSVIPDHSFAQNQIEVRVICKTFMHLRIINLGIMCECQTFSNTYSITDVELNLKPGVYLFLGYSEKDEKLLKAVTDQGAEEARGAIQGMVSFHNINNNKVIVVIWFIYI